MFRACFWNATERESLFKAQIAQLATVARTTIIPYLPTKFIFPFLCFALLPVLISFSHAPAMAFKERKIMYGKLIVWSMFYNQLNIILTTTEWGRYYCPLCK